MDDIPANVAAVGPRGCIVEALVSGRQCTVGGFAFAGSVEVYGVVDSKREPNRSSFSRYQYPSSLSQRVQARMTEFATQVIRAAEYDGGPFNIEFFHDDRSGRTWLLETNCRISQSHAGLFAKVDGASHHGVMVELALGRRPEIGRGSGEYRSAAKFFVRHWNDAEVVAVPDADRIAEIEDSIPGVSVHVAVRPGQRLSELPDQDSYSYELGHVIVGGDSDDQLRQRFEECREALDLRLADVDGDVDGDGARRSRAPEVTR